MPEPRVSILMLTYDRPQFIQRAIASVYQQTFQEWELIIVQDGGNPETAGLVKDWIAKDERIRYFPRGVTGSIAEASNTGLRMARGEYVAILDDDDSWRVPNKLAIQLDFLDHHPDYVGCGGGYVVIDARGRELDRFIKPEDDAAVRSRALLANPIVNSTGLFRRAVNGSPFYYDVGMRQFADWDFWLTLGAAGKLYNFPQYLVNYALWEGGSSFRNQKANARAAIRIVEKHRRHYRGFAAAILAAWLYYGYACMPLWFRRLSYATLSAFKKALASGSRPVAKSNPESL